MTRTSSATSSSGRCVWWSVRSVAATSNENVVERQMLAVADHDLDVRRRIRACAPRQLPVHLDRDDLARARCDREREARPCRADVEHPLVAREGEQILEVLGERGRALRLQRRALVQPCSCGRSTHDARARGGEDSMPQASS